MRMETGFFGRGSDGLFAARVVIPTQEHARLGIGAHEDPRRLAACYRWCLRRFGLGSSQWALTIRDDADNSIFFRDKAAAIDFLAAFALEPAAGGLRARSMAMA